MTAGIHHVTVIAGPAHRNLDFYSRVLGQRLVKKTVNFDDPGTYHLYFGDHTGAPGTIMTFFPWAHAAPGRTGIGETQETAYRIPEAALGYWMERFLTQGVVHDLPVKRFGETVLSFRDPDGTHLALVAVPGLASAGAGTEGEVPGEHALQGFHGVTLLLDRSEATGAVLDVLGFSRVASEGSVTRYASGASQGGIVDIRAAGGFLPGRQGAGSVHHVAFRAGSDAEQARMVASLAELGLTATEQRDRNYFRSVYFREPGGVLFEIATDEPGFAVDEAVAELGQALKLPPGLEGQRARIEAVLPDLSGGTALADA